MITRNLFGYPVWRTRSPFEELVKMRRDMDRLFGKVETPASGLGAGVFPAINLTQNADNYYMRAELPGIRAQDLDIQVTGKNIAISGERKIPAESENAKYHRREREAGKFSRALTLPGDIDADKVDAKFKDGILTIVIPKAEAQKPRQIPVN
jgi:HSP20 family protein